MAVREGQRLGRFTLVRQLGKGGGGEAWEAALVGPYGFTRRVALKLLADGGRDPRDLENLVHEARVGALLQHPNLVATHEIAEADGIVFLAMELVDGPSVKELAQRVDLGGAVIVDLGVQACAGLAHLHDAELDGAPLGLVHRDVKPGNLLVDASGVVKVADFGISRRVGERHTSGTPGYAPPEQYLGQADARSDLFALGATLASLVLRAPPFGREITSDPTPIARGLTDRALLARIEAGLRGGSEVLARCLAPRPEDRYPSAAALQQALASLRGLQPPSPPLRELVATAADPAPAGLRGRSRPAAPETELTQVGRGNLSAPTDAFVARPERATLERALAAGHRWVSLTGPGGMGKTRLAVEVARAHDRCGGWWFDLGEAATPEAVTGALAHALGLELRPSDPLERAAHALRALGPAVAVFDEADLALAAVPDLVVRVLAAAPELTILSTARAPANQAGEHRVAIGPLPGPEAEALFRARVPRPLDAREQAEVEGLVASVDGMPLAIELLAARAARVPVSALHRDLSAHLAAATDPDRPRRSRTVEAALAGTVDALPDWARRALVRLAVFEGPFSARATAAVLDASELDGRAPLDALEHLTDLGLLRYDAARRRFSLSRIVRHFTLARAPAEERSRAERRHGRAYAVLGERDVLALLHGPQGVERFGRLCDDLDQLRAAAVRALDRGDAAQVVPLCRALAAVFSRRGSPAPLLALLDRAVGLPGLAPAARDELELTRARALSHLGQLGAARQAAEAALRSIRARPADPERCRLEAEGLLALAPVLAASLERAVAEVATRSAVELADQVGDAVLLAEAALGLGGILGRTARGDEGHRWLARALHEFRRLGSVRDEARALVELAQADHVRGRFPQAEAGLRAALKAAREAQDAVCELEALSSLGLLAKDLRRSREAAALYGDALALARAIGDRSDEVWLSGALGFLHLEQLDPEDARPPLLHAVALASTIEEPSRCQWEAALGRWSAARGQHADAARWIASATSRTHATSSSYRVWVGAAAAEVALRAGRSAEAASRLDELENWLLARQIEPGSRAHQEVRRVRALLAEER